MKLSFLHSTWLRGLERALSCLAVGVVSLLMCSGLSFAALNAEITSTASLLYAGQPVALKATVKATANITTANVATMSITAPAGVLVGATVPIALQINNTGTNALTKGSVTLTPPAGTNILIPVDPYGVYIAKQQADGSWLLTFPDLAAGGQFKVAASLQVTGSAVAGATAINATYKANGVQISQQASKLLIQNFRTPAKIAFKHLDIDGKTYVPAEVYHAGQTIYIEVDDGDQNVDPYTIQTVSITLADDKSKDSETITLTETGPNTGIFIGNVASTRAILPTPNNAVLSVSSESKITATYTDSFDLTDTAASAALVDPFGLVFDTATGLPIDGVTVSIVNVATGLPAVVYGDDGKSIYPSTLVTGGTATDSSGTVYTFAKGNYRFPFMALGSYKLVVTAPTGYSFPSQASTALIQALPTAPFAMRTGSRGDVFQIRAGPALNIDLPIDPTQSNLFVRKTTSTPLVGMGDRVSYQVNVENINTTLASSATTVQDILPLGLRYQPNSVKLDDVPVAEPTLSADGRQLTFKLGTIAAASTVKLDYVAVVGANAKLGAVDNIAFAAGSMLVAGAVTKVKSNISKATVTIREELIRSRGFMAGTVFVDEDLNGLHDNGEQGVSGVRIYMQDGRSVITDKDGRYHFDGLKPGLHVVQMDRESIAKRYQAVGLKQTRFAKNDYSQFTEIRGGGLHRANFRLVNRMPDYTPVTVSHALVEETGLVWANVDVAQHGDVPLDTLQAFYTVPMGWKYVPGSATLDGIEQEPEQTPFGLIWQLDEGKEQQRIRLAMRGGGASGLKQAIAYARFASSGTSKGRTNLASIHIQDTLKELRDQRSFTLHLKFGVRQAELPELELFKLNELVDSLAGLVIREMIVEGHTDNIPIAPRNRKQFASNLALSQARATYVADYLQQHLQLDEHVVMAVGKGDAEPVASNLRSKGRKQNRRVVLKIRADKISHDFSSTLKSKLAEAFGKAEAAWEDEQVQDVVQVKSKKEGIISPADGMSLPHAVASVRIILDSGLKAELTLDGEEISDERIGFKLEDSKTGKTTYTYIGVDFGKQGKHALTLKGLGPFGNARFEEHITVVRTGDVARIKLLEVAKNIADGKTPVRFRLALVDDRGVAINGGVELRLVGGDLTPLQDFNDPLLTRAASLPVLVAADGWVNMNAVSKSGTHRVSLSYNNVQENIEVYVKPEVREWIMVGLGEGTLGFNKVKGAVQPITQASEKDRFYQDGRLAFYAKGRLKGDFLLTLAYDTLAKDPTQKNNRFGDIDPNVMYTVYGDTAQQQFDASSSQKLYLKIEKDTFYALFGDYATGLSTTELSRYSRVFTGVKSEIHEDSLGFTAFATQTSQTMVSDLLQGNGTSGLYPLSRQHLISNTDVVRIETMDRFKSEVVLRSIKLTRHLDYDIDYVLGTIWFKQPVLSRDADLNPILIRVEYESDDLTDSFTTAGGRVYLKPSEHLEVGGTFVSEGRLGGSNALSGVDVKAQLSKAIELRAEAAQTIKDKVAASAWKVEARLTTEALSGKAYARQQSDFFGLGQQLGSENAMLKVGADAKYRLDKDTSVTSELFRQETLNTGAIRDMAQLQYNKRVDDYDMRAGVRANRDQDGSGQANGSTLGNVGVTSQLTNRLSLRADHEQALSQNNGVDFPTRSSLGANYRITAGTSLSATQEWTQGQYQNTTSTRLGVNTQPWNGAQMTASYEQQLDEAGMRSFANAGLLQTWQMTQALSFSASLDQTKTLTKATPVQMNLNAPVATGGDFTAYSLGVDYRPTTWSWTNRIEYRISALSTHRGVSMGIQGSPMDVLAMQLTARWQKDAQALGTLSLLSDVSMRAAWRTPYDELVLLNRSDVRQNEQTGGTFDTKSTRYINNLTANWQTSASWQLLLNHGIKLSDETLGVAKWSGITDLLGLQLIYDINEAWDITMQASALRVRHLANLQPNAGVSVGYNMFDNFWLSSGYNFVGFYDADFAAAEYSREGVFMRFRFKFDQHSLKDMLR